VPHRKPDDSKRRALARAGALHPNPEQVTDELFSDNPFFDPRDGVQVKYEMLRRVRVEGRTVSQAAAASGLSRPTYYQAREAFERDGIVGLLPEKKGPKRAHKLTAEVLDFVETQLEARPQSSSDELARQIRETFGVSVHPKSITRARARAKKKAPRRS
jgi:transposase